MTQRYLAKEHSDLTLQYIEVVREDLDAAKLPVVVLIHGRGADCRDLADLAPMIDRGSGYRFICPNAPKPFEYAPGMSFGFTWFEGWPPELESVRESRTMLLKFLDEMQKRYDVDDSRTLIAGFSQGGMMALEAGYRRKHDVAGIAVMSGGIYEPELPDLDAHRATPVIVVHGTLDDVLPVQFAHRTKAVLQRHGIEPEYFEFPMGHQVSEESIDAVTRFVTRVLG